MDPVLSPLPNVPTEAERRAAVLRRDPRALALMLAPDAGLRAAGQRLDESQLQRAVEGRQGLGAQFQQAMERGQEERQRVFGEQEMGLKGRQLGIEAGKLNLAQQQLEMGRWMPIQGADGITYLYDQKTHQIVNGIVPGQGWMAGGGQPGATVAPGQLGLGGGRPTALPAVPGAGTVGGPSPAGRPAGAATGPFPQPPQAQGLPPQARQFMELAARQKMPPEALKELDAGDKTRQAIMQGLQAVQSQPQAFTPGQAVEEYAPGEYLKSLGRAIHSRTRDPADTQARAAVYGYTVGQMHDYFGARMTEPEFQRAGLFLPSVSETPENIKAKLYQALDAIDRRQQRLQSVYMPALSMFSGSPGPAAGAPPAPGAAGAPGAPGASPAPGAGTVRIPVTRNGVTRYWNGQSWED